MNAILLQCTGAATILKCGCNATVTTNWQDVAQSAAIAIPICAAIVSIAWFAKGAVLSWKAKEVEANKEERKDKREKEKEESERKLKSDLLDKYLDFLKDQTKEKEFVAMEELENQRKSFADGLSEYLKNDISLYLCTNGKNAKEAKDTGETNEDKPKETTQPKAKDEDNDNKDVKDTGETNEDKLKETTEPKAKDGDNDNNEKKKQSLYNLIEELKKYIHPEKLKPAVIDQTKIERYRKTLAYLIKLSQQGKLNEFSIEELNQLFK